MDKLEKARNWKIWDKAREKLKSLIDELDGEAFTHEEIILALEDLTKGVEQLNKFWRDKFDKV